jgi:hypothetical protein
MISIASDRRLWEMRGRIASEGAMNDLASIIPSWTAQRVSGVSARAWETHIECVPGRLARGDAAFFRPRSNGVGVQAGDFVSDGLPSASRPGRQRPAAEAVVDNGRDEQITSVNFNESR